MQLLLGAMDQEINGYLTHLKDTTHVEWNGWKFHVGTIGGEKAVVAKCGVGKVLSAMVTQKILDTFDIHHILFTGIAGSLNPVYEIGDIVIAKDTIQHDMDVSGLGFKRGHVPYTDIHIIECEKKEMPILSKAAEGFGRIHIGRILTGDLFLTKRNDAGYSYLQDELHGDAVEMEGASVGTVALINKIPFNLVRIVSDRADGEAPHNFGAFLNEASDKILSTTFEYLKLRAADA